MTVIEVGKEILKLEPRVKFIGTFRNGNSELNFNKNINLDENTVKLSITQTPHIIEDGKRFTDLGNLESVVFGYDKMKLFSLPLKEGTITFGTNNDTNDQEIISSVSTHLLDIEPGLVQTSNTGIKGDTEKNKEEIEKQTGVSINYFTDPWQRYVSTLIEFWRQITINSIHANEKMLKGFWENSIKKDF